MSDFTDAIDRNLDGCEAVSVGYCPGCEFCPGYQEGSDEGGFSQDSCECCGSTLGGNRYSAHYIRPDDNGSVVGQVIHHMEVCEDCLLYLANGDEPETWEG